MKNIFVNFLIIFSLLFILQSVTFAVPTSNHEQLCKERLARAENLLNRSKIKDAKKLFDELSANGCDSSTVYTARFDMARILYFEGDLLTARNELKSLLKDQTGSDSYITVKIYRWLGDCDFFQGDYKSAIRNYKIGWEKCSALPGGDILLYQWGVALERIGNPADALGVYNLLIKYYTKTSLAQQARFRISKIKNQVRKRSDKK